MFFIATSDWFHVVALYPVPSHALTEIRKKKIIIVVIVVNLLYFSIVENIRNGTNNDVN